MMTRPDPHHRVTSGMQIDPTELGLEVAHRAGREVIVRCPYHDDGRPSATFDPTTGLFFCFSCGASSTAVRLARLLGGRLIERPAPRVRPGYEDWRRLLAPCEHDDPYLAGRRVTNDQVDRWRIGSLPGATVIPVPNVRGHDVGVIVRRHQGTPKYLFLGEKVPLWPVDWLAEQPSDAIIYVVEGVFGRLRAERAGINAVAVMGAAAKRDVIRYLQRFNDVRVFFDADFAGYSGAGRLVSLLPNVRVVVPGGEADELSPREWRRLDRRITADRAHLTTRRHGDLAILSGDPDRYRRFATNLNRYPDR